jgi:3D-(3,5/4)-trihydroxycyclohexane-1,2-dione acylhydrolase (decyclizing)
MRQQTRTSVVVIETDYHQRVGGNGSWWDVPIAEVSEVGRVDEAFLQYREAKKRKKTLL